jgi:hypothetical protein
VLSSLEVFDDTRKTKPTERMFAVKQLVWCQHLLGTNLTVFVILVNFNLQNLLSDLVKSSKVSHNFDFSKTELNFICQKLFLFAYLIKCINLFDLFFDH